MTDTDTNTETEMTSLAIEIPTVLLPLLASMAESAEDRFRFDGRVLGVILAAAEALPEGTPEIENNPVKMARSSIDTVARLSAMVTDTIDQLKDDGRAVAEAAGVSLDQMRATAEDGVELPEFDRTSEEAEVMATLGAITPQLLAFEGAALEVQNLFNPLASLLAQFEALEAEAMEG